MSEPAARVLLLLASNSYKAEDFLGAVGDLALRVTVGSDHEAALASEAPGSTLALDFDDPEASLDRIVAYHETEPIDAIVAAEDEGALLAARAAAALALRHNPPAAVEAARYKDRARERLSAAGLLSPPFRSYPARADPERVAAAGPIPCVVKPVSLSASRGVIRADGEAELAAAFRRCREILAAAREEHPGLHPERILVEGFVPGAEVALEGLLSGGDLRPLAILDKPDPLEGPYFEETLFVTPSRLPAEDRAEVVRTTERAARALGLREGPVHAELRINERGVWPIELAPRSIGGLCSRLFRYRSGVALEELILRHALGRSLPDPDQELAAAVLMLPTPRAGTLREVANLEAAAAVPGIEDVVISVPKGSEVVPLPEGHRYLGFLFARGETPEEVEAALRRAHEALEIVIE